MSSPLLFEELWLDILGRLDYFDLLQVRRLNRSFRALVAHPALAWITFEGEPDTAKVAQATAARSFTLHPLATLVEWRPSIPYDRLTIRRQKGGGASPHVLSEQAAQHTPVTYPPVGRLVVRLFPGVVPSPLGQWIEIKRAQGVTVGQLFRAWCKLLARINAAVDLHQIMAQMRQAGLWFGSIEADDTWYPNIFYDVTGEPVIAAVGRIICIESTTDVDGIITV